MRELLSREAAAATGILPAWWARAKPSAPAVISSSGSVSFAELNARTNQTARGLRRRGLAAGGPSLLCDNTVEFAEKARDDARRSATDPDQPLPDRCRSRYLLAEFCDAKALVADASSAEVAGIPSGAPGCGVRLLVGAGEATPTTADWKDFAAAREVEDPSDLADPALGVTTCTPQARRGGASSLRHAAARMLVANLQGYREDGGDAHLCTGPLSRSSTVSPTPWCRRCSAGSSRFASSAHGRVDFVDSLPR